MTHHHVLTIPRAMLTAALVAGAAAAQAASGYTISKDQEALVGPGMSAAQVQQTLGHPGRSVQFGNEPGPTFTYHVVDNERTIFEVDFGADGKVVSTDERVDDSGGPGHGR